ncbi:MAG: DUF692 domain-containing protein [Pseudomonadales bacterium]|nr:DUF692 domain-containing protein [Pseudomonadales bacterium]
MSNQESIRATSTQIQGAGLGLRIPHIKHILSTEPDIPWFELQADNWLYAGGLTATLRSAICERYPVVLHGVGLSLGATDALDWDYLKAIKVLIKDTGAHWYSEHASFSKHQGRHVPDLLPLPYTEEAIRHLSERIMQVQDFLAQPLLLENVSSYIQYEDSDMDEGTFFSTVVKESGCDVLLDLNNLYVSAYNHGIDAEHFLQQLPAKSVKQIHLAGYSQQDEFLIDTHGSRVSEPVWDLYKTFLQVYESVPAMIEWDNNLPGFSRLNIERQKIVAMQSHIKPSVLPREVY